uniref:Uncharacterized protein n=1 Tax=Caenorhabditis japonica TaxID=281687 RepID=A0A8R1EUG4_CAEJA
MDGRRAALRGCGCEYGCQRRQMTGQKQEIYHVIDVYCAFNRVANCELRHENAKRNSAHLFVRDHSNTVILDETETKKG